MCAELVSCNLYVYWPQQGATGDFSHQIHPPEILSAQTSTFMWFSFYVYTHQIPSPCFQNYVQAEEFAKCLDLWSWSDPGWLLSPLENLWMNVL